MSTTSQRADIAIAAKWLSSAGRVAVLTGAGVSKESGIPTFRDAQTGMWANYDPERLATPEGFMNDPSLVWQWYEMRREKVQTVEPNAGHHALVELETLVPTFDLITQNVDGLHRKSGSKTVIELHGNIMKHKCFNHGHEAVDVQTGLKEPPKCNCGSLIRPAVVWFGEALPAKEIERATEASSRCDVMIVAGTSGIVQPAASLPFAAKRCGAKVIEVNPEPTPITEIADLFLKGPSGVMLPLVVQELKALHKSK